jgi:GH18 family chitinase
MNLPRRIAYYELFAMEDRSCDTMQPENIAAGALTLINLAFQVINEDNAITDD